jgi:hypothetical protein
VGVVEPVLVEQPGDGAGVCFLHGISLWVVGLGQEPGDWQYEVREAITNARDC